MSDKTATPGKKRTPSRAELIRKYGFYAPTFTAEELRYLDENPDPLAEFRLLRTKILRLAKLTPLRKINDKELDALVKLIRVVAALDALERTGVMRSKVEGPVDPALAALAEMDADEL